MSTPGVSYLEETFQGAGGVEIFRRSWLPDGRIRGTVAIVHGMSEHGGRYKEIAHQLCTMGFAVFSSDHRGHGKSGGKRKYIDSFENLVADQAQTINHAKQSAPDMPLIVLGHSMGGLASAFYTAITCCNSDEFALPDGLILSGTATRVSEVSPAMAALLATLSPLTPWLPVGSVKPETISHDETTVRNYIADPLVINTKLPLRSAAELVGSGRAVRKHLANISMPLLAIHGQDDPIIPELTSREIVAAATSLDKTLKIFPGALHEVHNELPPTRNACRQLIYSWVDSRF